MVCSIIIRSFNEERHIGRLLDGIARQQLTEGNTIEVIVVDSGSSDSTVAIAEKMGAKVVHISKEEFSFGRALNMGCSSASGDILLFASAHVYPVYTDWVEKMMSPFTSKDIALVYGRQVGNEMTRFSEHEVFAKWFPSQSNYDQPTPFCNNANCAIRRSLWGEQPYDEYLTGLEDLDWASKMMSRGYKIAYEAEAPVVHVHEESRYKIKNRYQREAIALKKIMPKVHFSYWDFLRLFISNTVSDCIQALNSGVLYKELRSIVGFRLMQFYGTYLGHNQKGVVTSELKNRFYYPNAITRKRGHPNNDPKHSKRIEYS